MSDPKLSKSFRDAMKAPIGSTMRKTAGSTFSIMSKVKGVHNAQGGYYNGQGGMFGDAINGMSNFIGGITGTNTQPSSPATKPSNPGNMTIFPAAPAFKKVVPPPVGGYPGTVPITSTTTPTYTPPVKTNLFDIKVNAIPKPQSGVLPGTTLLATSTVPVAKTPVVAPISTYKPGAIAQGLDWITQKAVPNAAKYIGAGAAGIAGGLQYVVQNGLQKAGDVGNYLFGEDTSTPEVISPIDFKDTAGGKVVKKIADNINKTNTTQPITTTGTIEDFNNIRNALKIPGAVSEVPGGVSGSTITETKKTDSSGLTTGHWNAWNPSDTTVGDTASNGAITNISSNINTNSDGAKNMLTTSGVNSGGQKTSGYGGEIVPSISSKVVDNLTPDEKKALFTAQAAREGSTLPGNPWGIKLGGLTKHWVDEGLAKINPNKAKDGGQFLIFKDEATANAARDEMLFGGKSIYTGKTVDAAMKLWSNYKIEDGTTSSLTTSSVPGATSYKSVQDAVAQGVGAQNYAISTAKSEMPGGSLINAYNELEAKKRKEYGLEEKELALSEAKTNAKNLMPALQDYIRGKDEYLKDIDSMINKTELSRKDLDMGNPAVKNSYNNYLAYLYRLKGKQTARYGTYLDSAKADAEYDIAKLESDFTTAQNHYNTDMTKVGGLLQSDYNDRVLELTNLYTSLQDAPTRLINQETLALQHQANLKAMLGAGADSTDAANPKLGEDKAKFIKEISYTSGNEDGALDPSKFTNTGLAGFIYDKQNIEQTDGRAAAYAIMATMNKGLQLAGADNSALLSSYSKMIDDLEKSSTAGSIFAEGLRANLVAQTKENTYSSLKANISGAKKAIDNLIKKNPDVSTWKKDYPILPGMVMDMLYSKIQEAIAADPSIKANPTKLIDILFGGTDDANINAVSNLIYG